MLNQDKKERFIELRAAGYSYSKICQALNIGKSTCVKWNKELSGSIRPATADRFADLYKLYRMGREQYIETLGEMLKRIDAALNEADFSTIPPDKLLRIKLDYEKELQSLHIAPESTEKADNTNTGITAEQLTKAAYGLYMRIRDGTTNKEQARAEIDALEATRRAVADYNDKWQ